MKTIQKLKVLELNSRLFWSNTVFQIVDILTILALEKIFFSNILKLYTCVCVFLCVRETDSEKKGYFY